MARIITQPTIPDDAPDSGFPFAEQDTVPGSPPHFNGDTRVSVADLMNFPPIVPMTAPLGRVARLLARSRAPLLVVVDTRRHPVGVVTPLELVKAADSRDAQALPKLYAWEIAADGGPRIQESTHVAAAAEMLTRNETNYLLVVGPEGRLAGVVWAADLLGAMV
jgi:CBS-domain-containing membrane protein